MSDTGPINAGSLVLCRYATHNGQLLEKHYGLVIEKHQIQTEFQNNSEMYVVLVNAKAEFLFIGALSHVA